MSHPISSCKKRRKWQRRQPTARPGDHAYPLFTSRQMSPAFQVDDVLSHPCSASLVQELMLAKQAEEESSRATKEDAFSRCVWNLSIFTR